ncbi:uncharacterized protein I303_101589 [Kwoniella dejecticola CBS 10117]|uniref:Uncharacterized protein n=1 Tax=Kwoniella dejecticola CBS 10117 TaxID=1296121 RepID=A0A1A6ADC8_9TREE|nr:uncharacterized protein I303_02279 [Kwoniella dejecticola CBS 10117]OBR88060.1 hypothetical protein I303_02279 [Kwoniella dejecticola CBS 10117]
MSVTSTGSSNSRRLQEVKLMQKRRWEENGDRLTLLRNPRTATRSLSPISVLPSPSPSLSPSPDREFGRHAKRSRNADSDEEDQGSDKTRSPSHTGTVSKQLKVAEDDLARSKVVKMSRMRDFKVAEKDQESKEYKVEMLQERLRRIAAEKERIRLEKRIVEIKDKMRAVEGRNSKLEHDLERSQGENEELKAEIDTIKLEHSEEIMNLVIEHQEELTNIKGKHAAEKEERIKIVKELETMGASFVESYKSKLAKLR